MMFDAKLQCVVIKALLSLTITTCTHFNLLYTTTSNIKLKHNVFIWVINAFR